MRDDTRDAQAPSRAEVDAARSRRVRRGWRRLALRAPAWFAATVTVLLLGPLGVLAFGGLPLDRHWSEARRDSTGQAPLPADEPAAIVQVYGARTFNWRGAFGIHTWIAAKRERADAYTVYHVVGWNVRRGRSAVTVARGGPPDFLWFDAHPRLLAERRGEGVENLVDRIEAAVAAYPHTDRYRAWPGPNSNTFVAHIARQVPELGLDLPPTAIGKDWLPDGRYVARTPSGTGWQVSVHGVLGVAIGLREGLEFNLLGLNAGVDIDDAALRLPGLGWVGPGVRGGLP
jgi:hypothetical protein